MGMLRLDATGRGSRLLVRRLQRSHDDRGDAVAATGQLLGREGEAGDGRGRPDDRHPADGLGEQSADRVDVLLVDVDVEELGEVVDVMPAGTRSEPSSSSSTAGDSLSCSSSISPTISSMMSSMVTSPAVPPYSSTTIAKWFCSRCISLSRSSTGLLSGTKCIGRITWSTGVWEASGAAYEPPRDVLEVEQAPHVVAVLADDGDPREARAEEQRHRAAQRSCRGR